MNAEPQRTCPSCGNEFSGAMEFCPVCMLRKGLGGGVASGSRSAHCRACRQPDHQTLRPPRAKGSTRKYGENSVLKMLDSQEDDFSRVRQKARQTLQLLRSFQNYACPRGCLVK